MLTNPFDEGVQNYAPYYFEEFVWEVNDERLNLSYFIPLTTFNILTNPSGPEVDPASDINE